MTKKEAITILDQIRKILLNSNSWLESTHQPITEAFDMAIEALEQPERKKGKWLPIIEVNENGEPYQAGVYCSECGNGEVYEPNFCSCCGADLRGEKNEQTN